MGGKTSTSTSRVEIPPEVLARYNAVNTQAENVAQNPFQQYGTQASDFVAQLNEQQGLGIQGINAAAGSAQPYFNAATGMTAAASGAANAGELDINRFMSPYVQNVAETTAALMGQQNQQAQSGALGTAASSGAFGGDRAGIAAANLNQQQNLAMGNTLSNIYNQGYGQALGAAQQQQGVNLAAEQANLARQMAGGAQLANLGTAAQNAALTGAQAQIGAGTLEQQTEQAGIEALYNQFQQQQAYPFQVAQFLANIAMGTGALSGSTTTSTQPAPFWSDRRLKSDIRRIGQTDDGMPIYKFKYKGDDKEQTHIGLMADEVEKKRPDAVGLHPNGYKYVDYDRATDSMGGGVSPAHSGQGFASGGAANQGGVKGPYDAMVGSDPYTSGYVPDAYLQIGDLMQVRAPDMVDPNAINYDPVAYAERVAKFYEKFLKPKERASGGYVPQANLPVGGLAIAQAPAMDSGSGGLADTVKAASEAKDLWEKFGSDKSEGTQRTDGAGVEPLQQPAAAQPSVAGAPASQPVNTGLAPVSPETTAGAESPVTRESYVDPGAPPKAELNPAKTNPGKTDTVGDVLNVAKLFVPFKSGGYVRPGFANGGTEPGEIIQSSIDAALRRIPAASPDRRPAPQVDRQPAAGLSPAQEDLNNAPGFYPFGVPGPVAPSDPEGQWTQPTQQWSYPQQPADPEAMAAEAARQGQSWNDLTGGWGLKSGLIPPALSLPGGAADQPPVEPKEMGLAEASKGIGSDIAGYGQGHVDPRLAAAAGLAPGAPSVGQGVSAPAQAQPGSTGRMLSADQFANAPTGVLAPQEQAQPLRQENTQAGLASGASGGMTYTGVAGAGAGFTDVIRPDGTVERRTGTRNWRNNNPGNIEYGNFAKSHGAIGSDGRFAVFPTYEAGRAAKSDLLFNSSGYRGMTISGAISRYAPPSENNTRAYIESVTNELGVSPDTQMSDLTTQQRDALLTAIERVEGGGKGTTGPVSAYRTQQVSAAPYGGGLAPQEAPQKAYEDRNTVGKFMHNPDGSLNRNAILSILSGLGGMASSSSRYLGSSILQGLGAGANTYQALQRQASDINLQNAQAASERIVSKPGMPTVVNTLGRGTVSLGEFLQNQTDPAYRISNDQAVQSAGVEAAQRLQGQTQKNLDISQNMQQYLQPYVDAERQAGTSMNYDQLRKNAEVILANDSAAYQSANADHANVMEQFEALHTMATAPGALSTGPLQAAMKPAVSFVNSTLRALGVQSDGLLGENATSQDVINKINTIRGFSGVSGADLTALRSLEAAIAANPNEKQTPEAVGRIMSAIMVANQRKIDKYEFDNAYLKASPYGTMQYADPAFEDRMQPRYDAEMKVMQSLMTSTDPSDMRIVEALLGRSEMGQLSYGEASAILSRRYGSNGGLVARYFVKSPLFNGVQ